MERRGIINVHNSLKNPIVDRIRFLDLMFSIGRASFIKIAKKRFRAVQSAVWTTRGDKETRLDNGYKQYRQPSMLPNTVLKSI